MSQEFLMPGDLMYLNLTLKDGVNPDDAVKTINDYASKTDGLSGLKATNVFAGLKRALENPRLARGAVMLLGSEEVFEALTGAEITPLTGCTGEFQTDYKIPSEFANLVESFSFPAGRGLV